MMSKRRPGKLVLVTEGQYLNQQGFMYYDLQTKEAGEAGKLFIVLGSGEKILIDVKKLKLIGFVD